MIKLSQAPSLIELPSRLWLILVTWFTAAAAVAASGLLDDPNRAPPILAGGVTLPVVTAYLVWRNSAALRDWVGDLPLQALIALHALRTVGLGFILLSLHDHLHPGFAWPAGIGDAMAAMGALAIAINLAQGRPVSTARIRSWNRFGMLDFVIAVAAGFSLRSTLLGDVTLNTDLMGSLPLALFPLFAVPLFFITHLAIAAKLAEHDRR